LPRKHHIYLAAAERISREISSKLYAGSFLRQRTRQHKNSEDISRGEGKATLLLTVRIFLTAFTSTITDFIDHPNRTADETFVHKRARIARNAAQKIVPMRWLNFFSPFSSGDSLRDSFAAITICIFERVKTTGAKYLIGLACYAKYATKARKSGMTWVTIKKLLFYIIEASLLTDIERKSIKAIAERLTVALKLPTKRELTARVVRLPLAPVRECVAMLQRIKDETSGAINPPRAILCPSRSFDFGSTNYSRLRIEST